MLLIYECRIFGNETFLKIYDIIGELVIDSYRFTNTLLILF